MELSLADTLVKVALFFLVQGLVYLILSKSSNIFSSNSNMMRSHSFRPARSLSIRRMLATLADLPAGGELSPSSTKDLCSPSYQQNSNSSLHLS